MCFMHICLFLSVVEQFNLTILLFIVLFPPFPVFGTGIDYLEQFGSSSVSMTYLTYLPGSMERKDETVQP